MVQVDLGQPSKLTVGESYSCCCAFEKSSPPKASSFSPAQTGRDAYLCAEYLWDGEYYVQDPEDFPHL